MKNQQQFNNGSISKEKKESGIYFILGVLIFFGFYPFNLVGEFFGYTGSGISYFVRVMLIAMSFFTIFKYIGNGINKRAALFLAFVIVLFFIYALRVGYDTVFQLPSLVDAEEKYIVEYLLITVLPACSCAFLIKNYNEKLFFEVLSALSLLSLLLAVSLFSNQLSNQGALYGSRLATEKVNPIALGAFFSTTFIVGVSFLLNKNRTLMQKFYAAFICLLCAVFIFFSGSRGALISLLLTLLTYIIFSSKNKVINFIFIVSSVLLVIPFVIYIADEFFNGIDVFRGFLSVGQTTDMSSQLRLMSYKHAVEQFVDNPILGDLLVERVTVYYPHNIFLEILMALGLLGGLPFFLYIAGVFYLSIKLMRKSGFGALVSLLWLQQLYSLQFSGSVFYNYQFWSYSIVVGIMYFSFSGKNLKHI